MGTTPVPSPDIVASALVEAFAQRSPSGLQSASVVAAQISEEPLRSELEKLLSAGHSRTAIAEALSKQYTRSIPTIREALDEVFPRERARKARRKPGGNAPENPAGTAPGNSGSGSAKKKNLDHSWGRKDHASPGAPPVGKPSVTPPVAQHAGHTLAEV